MFIHTYSIFDFFIARVQLQNALLLLPHEPENFYSLQNEEFTSLTAELEQLWAGGSRRNRRRR